MTTTKVRYNQIKTGLPVGGDVNYNDVSLLLHMNGTDGSTTFTDSSSASLTPVIVGGNTSISVDQYKFGGSSAYFGGSGDYLQYDNIISNWTSESYWTVEMWIYPTSLASDSHVFANYLNGSSNFSIGLHTYYEVALRGDGATLTSTTIPQANTWTHLAVVWNNGTATLYVNGTAESTYTGSLNLGGGTYMGFGAFLKNNPTNVSNFFAGYIDEVRFTKGVARYTSNFSVSTAAFPAFESKEGKGLRVGANGTIELES